MVGAVFNRDLVEHQSQVVGKIRSHKITLFFVPCMDAQMPRAHGCAGAAAIAVNPSLR
jgi:hypothetical protein